MVYFYVDVYSIQMVDDSHAGGIEYSSVFISYEHVTVADPGGPSLIPPPPRDCFASQFEIFYGPAFSGP